MIAKLIGLLDEVRLDSIVINVHGVGYLIYATQSVIDNSKVGESISIYIEPHIYENNIKLYGFSTQNEQDILKLLIRVRGISHKIALNLIDGVGCNSIVSNVQSKNHTALKVKGIGEKLAKRIVTDLYDDTIKISINIEDVNSNASQNEAVSALINLGYNSHIAYTIVRDIVSDNSNTTTSEIIKLALKKL